jgi:exosortase
MLEMKTMVASPDIVAPCARQTFAPIVFTLLFLSLLWFEVIHHLGTEWSINPQYGYGWTVPFLTVYLLWKRWLNRPAAAPPPSRLTAVIAIAACALLLFPIRFVAEANPDWRMLSWLFALSAMTISLGLIFLQGGVPWLRRFAFPFLFFLVAVPWPTGIEQAVVQSLMGAVTALNVFVLNIAGIPALRHGNVIEVASGLIGIEEACSGVRSLQATLMISLFLGEFYSFNLSRRILLVLAGGLLAFVCNLARTGILVWLGARRGAGAIAAWHDPAGLSIFVVCLFGLWLLSLWIRHHAPPEEPEFQGEHKFAPLRFSSPLIVSLALWLLLIEAGTQIWFRAHQSPVLNLRWGVRWPDAANAFKTVSIAPETESLLRYNEGGGASWAGADGHRWMMYFFRWLPGRTAALFVKIHRPDICLPASGMKLVSDNGIRLVNVNGINLPIRSYRFDDHGAPLHVFYCYWDARSSYANAAAANEEDWSARGRIRAAIRGRRELGAQMLELVVWDYEQDAEAEEALRQRLTEAIKRG